MSHPAHAGALQKSSTEEEALVPAPRRASGGANIVLFGGSGNDSLSSAGGSNITMIGGSGNSTLISSGGSNITLFGGSGNSSLNASGGTNVLMIAGNGNSTLVSSGGSNVTLFGGLGNDSLAASAGTSITLLGGSGNDFLSAAACNNVSVFGGTGNDTLVGTGGTSVTLFGGTGDDRLTATGSTGLTMLGGSGADFVSALSANSGLILGGSKNVTVVASGGVNIVLLGGSGNDSLASTGGTGVTLIGGAGQDTLTSTGDTSSLLQSGAPGIGAGNDLLQSTGGTSAGSDVIDPPAGAATNMLDFAAFGGPVSLNLSSAAAQTLSNGSSSLTLTLQTPAEINALMDSNFGDNITGNASGDRFFLGRNDTITGGGGFDSFFFAGSQLGSELINEASPGNTLNFYGLGAPITLNLNLATPQAIAGAAANNLVLTIPNPGAFSTVIGTPFGDTIVANGTADDTIIGAGGDDSLVAGNGNDRIQADVNQVVYLQFPTPSQTRPNDHIYTSTEEQAILQGLNQDFAAYQQTAQGVAAGYLFTLDQPTAQQLAQTTGGQYITLVFNAPVAGGAAAELDPGNLDLGGTAQVNITSLLGDSSAGLVPPAWPCPAHCFRATRITARRSRFRRWPSMLR